MRNKRLTLSLAGALVFGLVAVLLVSRYLSDAKAYTKSLTNVVVAKYPIPLGTKIKPDLLVVAQFPEGSIPEGAFDAIDKVANRVSITAINVREPVTSFKLSAEGTAGGLSAVIPEGYRAMTVKVDDVVGVSGFIMPGAFVDVVAVITPVDQAAGQNPISKIVLENIKVLANGQNIDQPKDGREATLVKAVTLQVTPEEAERLALAANEGKLQLVMRNYGDQEASNTRGVNKRGLITGEAAGLEILSPPKAESQKPAPAPAPSQFAPARRLAPAARREEVKEPATATPLTGPTVVLFEGAKRRSVEFP